MKVRVRRVRMGAILRIRVRGVRMKVIVMVRMRVRVRVKVIVRMIFIIVYEIYVYNYFRSLLMYIDIYSLKLNQYHLSKGIIRKDKVFTY